MAFQWKSAVAPGRKQERNPEKLSSMDESALRSERDEDEESSDRVAVRNGLGKGEMESPNEICSILIRSARDYALPTQNLKLPLGSFVVRRGEKEEREKGQTDQSAKHNKPSSEVETVTLPQGKLRSAPVKGDTGL